MLICFACCWYSGRRRLQLNPGNVALATKFPTPLQSDDDGRAFTCLSPEEHDAHSTPLISQQPHDGYNTAMDSARTWLAAQENQISHDEGGSCHMQASYFDTPERLTTERLPPPLDMSGISRPHTSALASSSRSARAPPASQRSARFASQWPTDTPMHNQRLAHASAPPPLDFSELPLPYDSARASSSRFASPSLAFTPSSSHNQEQLLGAVAGYSSANSYRQPYDIGSHASEMAGAAQTAQERDAAAWAHAVQMAQAQAKQELARAIEARLQTTQEPASCDMSRAPQGSHSGKWRSGRSPAKHRRSYDA